MIHGHPLNGTKFFTWGECDWGKFQQDFLAATDYDGLFDSSSTLSKILKSSLIETSEQICLSV